MKKVTIEITDKGWTTTVCLGDKTFVEKHKSTLMGSRSTELSFEEADEIGDELCEELSGFHAYDIMKELKNY